MLMKVLGSFFILISGTYMGFVLAKRAADRAVNLRQFLSCVVSLRAYMNYTAMPLNESLIQCASGANLQVTGFFRTAAQLLTGDYLMRPEQAIRQTIAVYRQSMALAAEDCELLVLLGCNLGRMNKAEQEKYLLMIEKRLEILEREAAQLRDRNSKMYRYLGICGSMMVILLLI